MPLIIDDLLDNILYRKKIYLPSDPKNKRKGSAVFLMTPDYASSVKTMNNPFFINNGRYESYYTEKDISFVLSENHKLLENSDEITITENSISQYNRITCTTTEELDQYRIKYNDDLTSFTAMIFVDHRNTVHAYAIVSEYGTRIYDIQAASYQIQRDLIEFVILLYNPKTVRITKNTNKKLYSKYGFKNTAYTKDNIMVREDTILSESLATAKIDIEIALWKSQIAITETIIKNFGDDNWMSHMYKGVKRKLVKIPLKQYSESVEDTIDRWKNKLSDQKSTLSFYLAVKEIDAKEAFDISEVIQEYVEWVDSLSCSKTLKLKIINEVIDSYKKSIKEYEFNLKRYRTLSDAQKRVENVAAIATKILSIFSWINITPLGIIRGKLISAVLPKSQKKAVLSEAELEAKIELYTKIVETLEEKKADIHSLDESVILESNNVMNLKNYEREDIFINIDNWSTGSDNILYVTGISGSGKSTIAKEIADKYNAEYIELDYVMIACSKNTSKAEKMINEKLKGSIALDFVKDNRNKLDDYDDKRTVVLMNDFNEWMIKHHKGDGKRYVLCGVYIYTSLNPNFVKTRPLIIKGTNLSTTIRRRGVREFKRKWDNEEYIEAFNKFMYIIIHGATKFYVKNSLDLDLFKDSIIKEVVSPEYSLIKTNDNNTHYSELVQSYDSSLNETFLFSKNDLYINFDKFESGRDNICFVTGLSGSGKSTETERLAKKYNAEWIELDIFEHCGGFTEDQLKEAGQVFYDYLSKHKELWDKLAKHQVKGQELRNEVTNFVKYVISWCSSHKDTKYIIEGVQIYSLMDIKSIKNRPMIIINTSMLKSMARKLRRSWNNRHDEDNDWKHTVSELPEMIAWYIDGENTFNDFKKELLEEYATIETSYYVSPVEEEAVLNHLGLQTENSITFLEGNDEVLVEADAAYNAELRKILFSERIKNHKEVMLLYDQVREDCPYIKYTFVNYERYTQRNLFIDWSFYTKAFFKNNIRKYDKAVDLYFDFINRFLEDNRLASAGYNQKTVFIPVDDWVADKGTTYWDYREDLNPISIIHRLVFRDIDKLRSNWGKLTFVFVGRNGYFKINFSNFQKKDLSRFLQNIKILVSNLPIVDDTDTPDNSTAGIVNAIIDRIEDKSNIKINNLTGASKASKEEIKDRIDNAEVSSDDKSTEEKLVDAITTAASTSKDDVETLQKMDNDEYIKQLVIDLRNSSPDEVSIEPTRVARMRKLNDQFAKKAINGKTVEQLLANNNDDPLPEISLPIDTINDDWKHLRFINYSKSYDLDADIFRCINHFSTTTVPISILDCYREDTSTSEDWVNTWTVKCEDSYGKRFTLKFDLPIVKNSRTMKLRGNDKTIGGQLMNLPIIKTGQSVCQMTSNYNKIFFETYGTSTGKSYVVADRLIKTINKMEPIPDITIDFGDNSRICSKYELPTDYIDLASVVSKITYFNRHIDAKYTYFFNQDELYEKYGDLIKDKDYLPIGIVEASKSKPTILYSKADVPVSFEIYSSLSSNQKFAEVYNTTNTSVRYTYSKASILSTEIPVAVIIGYYVGLISMLDRAGITYTVSDKRPKYDKNTQDIIRLSDAYILYNLDYDSSMLLNGLKECDLVAYSLKEVNSRKMWIEFLDNFGGRLKADGLDMFYDLMVDPITSIVCDKYELPHDFVDGLLYANVLLSDNKFNRHVALSGNRYRSNEIIAGYTYKALCNSYTQYRRDIRSGREAKMTMKQSAVIDLLFADNTFGDLSSLSDLLEFESINSTSFRGLSGMNSDRAYGLDKRTFDESMINVLALSTGFSANAGIGRQSTIDMNIDSARGYIKPNNISDMSVTKTFCMTEALTPFGVTSDDPFRSAMTFIQASKHSMRTAISDPLLVTNGADEALPYMTSNTFTYKAKAAGKVKEKTDEYMLLEYKNGSTEIVDLREKILKNSDGGIYISVTLTPDLKEGNIFSAGEIIAHDESSYTNNVGPAGNLSYDVGTFVKFAIIDSDEGFEDSAIETEWISEAMASTVIVNKQYTLPKNTNVYFLAKKGQTVQEGDPLLIFQNAFDEEDANMLIKTLSDDEDDDIVAELGRIPVYSKITGVIKDIKILRTVEIEELSPSLKKIVNDYEKDVKKFNKILDKYDPEKAKVADATYKLEPVGKLKNAVDSIRIEFSLAYEDNFSVGDKVVCYSALKGVSKGKIPKGSEPYSEYRPEEKIHYIQSVSGNMKRMVGSIPKVGAVNKIMVEHARQCCDIMGIKWKYFDEY